MQQLGLADKVGHCQHTSKEWWLPCPCSCKLLRHSCSWPRLLQQKTHVQPASLLLPGI